MNDALGFAGWLALLTAVTFTCRAAGYWAMQYVPLTPRLESALRRAPVAVMIGVVTPIVLAGGWHEAAGLVAVTAAMLVQRSDVLAALLGVAAVGLARTFGP